jgi:hypothetical protein
MTIQSISNEVLLSLGIHYDADKWALSELIEINKEYENSDIEILIALAKAVKLKNEDIVLSCYQRNGMDAFSLPRIHLNKEGELCLFFGYDLALPLTWNGKKWSIDNENELKCSPNKNKEGQVTSASMMFEVQLEFEGIVDDLTVPLPVLFKEAEPIAIVKDLQNGIVPEKGLIQIGKGGAKSLKAYMLPVGYYKIQSVNQPIPTKDGGMMQNGSVISEDGTIYNVLMGSIPFTVRKSTALLDAAKKGKQVRVKIDGACSTGTGIGAIGYAQVVPEGETAFEKFKFAATRHCVQMRKEAGPDGIIDKATIEKTRDEWLGSNSPKPEIKEEVLSVEETKEVESESETEFVITNPLEMGKL